MVVGTPKSWEFDAPDGGQSSLAILLQWLTTPGNYNRWQRAGKRKDANRTRSTRASLLHEIVALLHAAGLTHREDRDARSKIHDLEKAFWDAVAWKRAFEAEKAKGTTTTTKRRRGKTDSPDVHRELIRRCKHYDVLAAAWLNEDTEEPIVEQKSPARATDKKEKNKTKDSLQDGEVFALTTVCAPRKLWVADAVDKTKGKTSMEILLDWLQEHYIDWFHGGNTLRKAGTKEKLLQSIVEEMKNHGLAHRTTRDVRTKINELERSVRAAVAWRDTNGEAILTRHGVGNEVAALDEIRRGMTSVCKYFDRIGPVMVPLLWQDGRPTKAPKDTSDGEHSPDDSDAAPTAKDDEDESDEPTQEGSSSPPPSPEPEQVDDHVESPPEPVETTSPAKGYGYSGRSFVPILPRTATTSSTVVPAEKRTANEVLVSTTIEEEQPPRKKPTTQDAVTQRTMSDTRPEPVPSRHVDNEIAAVQRQAELDRLEHESRCRALEEERLHLEVTRQQVRVMKEKALARHELRQAGVPEDEINRVFPIA